jgi:hypothetical protein
MKVFYAEREKIVCTGELTRRVEDTLGPQTGHNTRY